MQVAPAELDLDRFDLVVDPDAEPADLDAVLARFLLNFVRNRSSSAAVLAGGMDANNSEAQRR